MGSFLGRVGVLVVHSVLLTVHFQRGQEIREKAAKIFSLIWRAEKVSRTSSEKWMKIYKYMLVNYEAMVLRQQRALSI